MSLQVKFLLNFSLLGANIVLEADTTATGDHLPEKLKDPIIFSGKTLGLDVKLSYVLSELLNKIGLSLQDEIPGDLLPDIQLKDFYISFTNTTGELDLIAVATIDGKEIKFFFQYTPASGSGAAKKEKRYVFGIQTDLTSLAGLPMIGEQLKDVKISDVGFVYASAKGDYLLPRLVDVKDESPGQTSKAIAPGDQKKTYNAGFNFIGELIYSKIEKPFYLDLPVSSGKQSAKTKKKLTSKKKLIVTAKEETPLQPAVKWINIGKKFGPLQVSKIGFSYASGRITLLFSGELGLSALVFSVEGLGLSFLPSNLLKGDNIKPQFQLSGLGLTVNKGPLRISGMFIKVDPKDNEIISFYGAAQIATSSFSISGVGAYSKLKTGDASFFVYAMYNGQIGGPSFFFVTGIAAGFGYNRTIRVPALTEVSEFPLVAMALSGTDKPISKVLSDLTDANPPWIPSSPGDYWLAVGIKFTSFKLIESFVLVTVQFGTRVEFAIIGLSLLKWPGKGEPIAYIELAVLAKFGPGSDVIAVTAMLTPNSYVLDKNCKLSGGFAFYAWVSGEHEGDFVITLGGYHPKYTKPAHYPSVDRLALNWKFSDKLSIHGEMYFALTPKVIMAGGRWEVVYNISFLSASVIIWADMIISWAPFYYRIDAGIIIRIDANIKILFIHIHFSFQMGCELHIWGPPFAGEIYVDWTIFSFTIPFGSSGKELPPPLEWDKEDNTRPGFLQSFVPKKDGKPQPLDTRFIGGVMNELKDDTGAVTVVFVNPYSLVIGIDSFFPVTDAYTHIAGEAKNISKKLAPTTLMDIAGADIPAQLQNSNPAFGIKPMLAQDQSANLTTNLEVWLTRKDGNHDTLESDGIVFLAGAKGVNTALWSNGNDAQNGNEPVIKNVLSGLRLHPVEEADTTIITIDLSNIYDPEEYKIPAEFLVNKDMEEKITTDDIDKNSFHATAQVNALNNTGFDLYQPGVLKFNELQVNDPLFLVSIGRKIPKK